MQERGTWHRSSKLKLQTKSTLVQFTHLRNTGQVHISLNDVQATTASSVKHLKVAFDSELTWDLHIRDTKHKARQRFYKLRYLLSRQRHRLISNGLFT